MRDSDTYYHKVTMKDCVSVASDAEKVILLQISPTSLVAHLADRWCNRNGYRLGGYLGQDCWDATKLKRDRYGEQ